MNRKGMYFASLSILIILLMVIGFEIVKRDQIVDESVKDLGKTSLSVVDVNIEGEKLRFYVDRSIDISKDLAMNNLKENVLYDKAICDTVDDYVVLDDCDYLDVEGNFLKYFNETFDFVLKNFDSSFDSEDFEFSFSENVLKVEGNKKLFFGIESFDQKSEYDIVLDDVLEFIKKYSKESEVPENLIKSLIMHESQGVTNAKNENIVDGRIDSTDHGLMQINDKAHPEFFDRNSVNFDCDAANSVECNIKAGVTILRNGFDSFGIGKEYTCTGEFYTGWEAALRSYNGWGCLNLDYVEKVLSGLNLENLDIVTKKIGSLNVNIDFEKDVEIVDLVNIVLKAKSVRDCSSNDDLVFCAAREGDFEYIFVVDEKDGNLIFDVEEIKSGDIIKFALKK